MYDGSRVINWRYSFIRAQLDMMDARVSTVDAKADGLRSEIQALRSELRELPRLVAAMLDKRMKRSGH